MKTMDEYKVVDRISPNYLEQGDLIKVKSEVYQVLNISDSVSGWDIVVLDNYDNTKIIGVPEGKLVSLVLHEDYDVDLTSLDG
jgi:hypothetical protein